jgi:hypothetical protein
MAGDVDNADLLAARQLEPGKAEVDGHSPVFLFLETVGVDACEGSNEDGFAVVDVPGGANYIHA